MRKIIVWLLCVILIMPMPVSLAETENEAIVPKVTAKEDGSMMVFRNADIRDVLSLIAEEYDLNIVMSEEVAGAINLRLKGASLNNTLDAILISRGYDYEIRDNIIRVGPAEVIEAERTRRLSKQELEPLVSEVIILRYLDANDVKPLVESMLTSRGSVSVLERRGYKGFQFGAQSTQGISTTSSSTGTATAQTGGLISERKSDEKPRSNTLMISDVRSQMERIKGVIDEIDVSPRQVLIDAKILEVTTGTLEDLGIDFNSVTTFAVRHGRYEPLTTDVNSSTSDSDIDDGIFSSEFPSNTDAGIHAVFQHLNGEDFTTTFHALLQDQKTKVLSAPRILTIENQEAAILVGEQYPIFETNVTDQGTATETLSFFQPIGISLQVIAQVTAENDVIMIIHPTVSSLGDNVVGTTGLVQPRINIREADTRVLVKNGETLVIGGLLEDDTNEQLYEIPLLGRIPFLGKIFTRRQSDVDQRNLLIFITPTVVNEGSLPLNPAEGIALQGIRDPDSYGTLYERRNVIRRIYDTAKKSYKKRQYDLARDQFIKVLALDSNHRGAIRYLKKMNALPERRLATSD
ncbi:MAG: secretin and TonB N-terminal domain-containing protein [Candidatus Omnitrophica bacterium]|nr:secretin and TonB N-terminal domain-containing protein [Candidatus Omnitrophota bacterium]